MEKIRWKITDVQGREIILKETTYAEHILGDHAEEDARIRECMEPQIKRTLISPDIIIQDEVGRNLYYNTVVIRYEGRAAKIKILKVVVETDREPNEIVTWTPLRKGDNIKNGEIEYERNSEVSDKEI